MKITLINGSTIETPENVDITRGKSSESIEWVKSDIEAENESLD